MLQSVYCLNHSIWKSFVIDNFKRVVVGVGRPRPAQRGQRERRRVIRRRCRCSRA